MSKSNNESDHGPDDDEAEVGTKAAWRRTSLSGLKGHAAGAGAGAGVHRPRKCGSVPDRPSKLPICPGLPPRMRCLVEECTWRRRICASWELNRDSKGGLHAP